jgi:hypothetical protein
MTFIRIKGHEYLALTQLVVGIKKILIGINSGNPVKRAMDAPNRNVI